MATKAELDALARQLQAQELKNKLAAAKLQGSRIATQQAEAGHAARQAAALAASPYAVKVIAPPANPHIVKKHVWHQDILDRPANSRDAFEDPFLRTLDVCHVTYAGDFDVTTGGGTFGGNFQISLSRSFWIANVSFSAFNSTTQADGRQAQNGYVTITDFTTQFSPLQDFPMQLAWGGAQGSAAVRSIWPLPYPVPAGGAFGFTYSLDGNAFSNSKCQFAVEGWWDFTHVF